MATPDKIEAVKNVTETQNPQSLDEERFGSNKEHFDNLMQSNQGVHSPSFERVDTKAFHTGDVHQIETPQPLGDDNVTAQQSGSATDQEKKGKSQQQNDEIEGVSGISSRASSSAASSSKSSSLLDEVSKLNKNVTQFSQSSPESIKTQAKEMISQLESVKTQLSQANTEIKPSYQTLLRNRLTHIDDNLKIALNKAGVEYTPPTTTQASGANAINKFIGILSNSQNQFDHLNSAIDNIAKSGKTIAPADMMAIQMKMGYIQQQIELFTSLLNKALESTKTIMNVQV